MHADGHLRTENRGDEAFVVKTTQVFMLLCPLVHLQAHQILCNNKQAAVTLACMCETTKLSDSHWMNIRCICKRQTCELGET